MKYYGVHFGKRTGVFTSWTKTKELIDGVTGAKFKAFMLPSEAEYFSVHGTDPPVLKSTSVATATPTSVIQSSVPSMAPTYHQIMKVNEDSETVATLISQYVKLFPSDTELFVYTDGSTINNGKKNARGGYGVFFSDPTISPISKRLTGKVTNNIAELTALIEGFKQAILCHDRFAKITVFTDSEYSFLAITERYDKWVKAGWKSHWKGKTTEIKNQALIEKAHQLYHESKVKLLHVRAHTGKKDRHSRGNEIADKLAGGDTIEPFESDSESEPE